MPRINIEQKWWSDPRRGMLIHKLGYGLADGVFLNAIKLSQDHDGQTFDCSGLLPPEWIMALLEVGLAKGNEKSLYISGGSEYHDWIKKQRINGKSGGKALQRKLNHLPEALAYATGTASGPASGRPSSSSSSSSSSSKNNTAPNSANLSAMSAPMDESTRVGVFVGKYVKAFQKRYGPKSRPDLSGKVQGQIKNYLKHIAVDRAVGLVEVYFQMNDPWFIKKCHDFGSFMENQNKVGLALDTGKEDPSKKSFKEILEEDESNGHLSI